MQKLFLAVAVAVSLAIVVMTLGPVAARPQLGHPQLERFAGYLALGAVWSLAYPRRMRLVAVVTACAAIGLELGQGLVPGRDPRLLDALAKILGAFAGVVSIAWFRTLLQFQRVRTE
jgi:VanZ family protein